MRPIELGRYPLNQSTDLIKEIKIEIERAIVFVIETFSLPYLSHRQPLSACGAGDSTGGPKA